jgi:hypothetical protein
MHHPEMSRLLARELERERIADARAYRPPSEARAVGAARRAFAAVVRPLRRRPAAPALDAARQTPRA